MLPDALLVARLAAVRRRMVVQMAALAIAAAGSVAVLVVASLKWRGNLTAGMGIVMAVVALVAAATAMVLARSRFSRAAAARALERSCPGAHNVIVTAEELLSHPERSSPWMRTRVLADAAEALEGASLARAVPLGSAALTLAGVAVLGTAVLMNVPQRVGTLVGRVVSLATGEPASAAGPIRITATVTPPGHTRLEPSTARDPDRIVAVAGSRLLLVIDMDDAEIRFGERIVDARRDGRTTRFEMPLADSGYFAIARRDDAATRRLLPVTVTPDRAPAVKVQAPGKDLLLPDGSGNVRIEATANDDYALASMALRYTKVSGSGEQFEFVEGELPIDITRASTREWSARGGIDLSKLTLEAGDSLVYRVIARDGRAGDEGFGSSDTYFVEIAGPGQVALEGFEMPPDRERYALSQQMIVLKLQRLRAREPKMAREALIEESAGIAAEQRSVRANFVFLMGGHVEDEEEEAEQSHEIQEGRLENTARREISVAINHMGRTEGGLAAVDTVLALKEAKLAVDALQRAFGKNRYLLRTLPVRSRVDPSRRLTGDLDEAGDWRREVPEGLADRQAEATRALLSSLIDLMSSFTSVPAATLAPRLAALSEEALRIKPNDPEWQKIARLLADVRDRVRRNDRSTQTVAVMTDALQATIVRARAQSSGEAIDVRTNAAQRAWAAEVRR